jgi:hypothetical protein
MGENMSERNMYIVRWEKLRESSQEEKDLLYFNMHQNDDSTYTVDAESVEELETQLTTEEHEKFAQLLKSLHELVAQYGEVFITIS